MRTRKLLSLLLAGTMMMGVLTGCWGGKKDDPSSGSGSGDSDITWTDPDYDKNKVDSSAEYTIAVDVGSNGTVSPGSPLKVKGGGSVSFTVTANAGRSITGIQIDNVDQPMKGSVEKLKVTLEKVSKNHTVTVKFTEKTYTVTASANSGGSIQYNNTVKYNGTASITATPEDFYKVASVTATMGGTSVTVENDGKQTYTVSKVTGNVVFTVTFEKASVKSVSVSGNPRLTYDKNEKFDVNGLTATVLYNDANSSTKNIPLNTNNAEVTITKSGKAFDAFTESGTYTVTVAYNDESVPASATSTPWIGEAKVNVLNQAEAEIIKNSFATAGTKWSQGKDLTLKMDNTLARELEKTGGHTISINGKSYDFIKYGPVDSSRIDSYFEDFYNRLVEERLNDSGTYKNGTVCISVDQLTGECSMWIVIGYPEG